MQLRKYCVFLKEKHLKFRNVRSKMDILGISSDKETQIRKKNPRVNFWNCRSRIKANEATKRRHGADLAKRELFSSTKVAKDLLTAAAYCWSFSQASIVSWSNDLLVQHAKSSARNTGKCAPLPGADKTKTYNVFRVHYTHRTVEEKYTRNTKSNGDQLLLGVLVPGGFHLTM